MSRVIIREFTRDEVADLIEMGLRQGGFCEAAELLADDWQGEMEFHHSEEPSGLTFTITILSLGEEYTKGAEGGHAY